MDDNQLERIGKEVLHQIADPQKLYRMNKTTILNNLRRPINDALRLDEKAKDQAAIITDKARAVQLYLTRRLIS